MRRGLRGALVGVVVALAMLSGSGAPKVNAAGQLACTLTPVLLDTTMNQGLQSYPQLVRGKETLVRFYFALPSCAVSGNAIQLNTAQLTVKNQSASGAVLTTAAALAPIGTAPAPLITSTVKQIDATSDPKWVVNLVGPTSSSFTASFEASVKWQSKTCATCALSTEATTAFSFAPGTRSTLITKTVAARTNAARILIVPMGLPPGGLAADDQQTLQNALAVLSRAGPFSDSGGRLGDLLNTTPPQTAGVRYTINSGFLDLTALLNGSGKFCGNNSNFGTIDSSLASILQSFNSLNGANPADKVVGVVPGSLGIASSVDATCFEGESSPGGIDSWVRLGPISGAVFVQEVMHNWGIEPFSRSNGAFHSIYTTAHATAGDPGKTYNVLERAYVKSDGSTIAQNADRTGLISNINNAVTNSDVLLENADWNDALCFLGGPIPALSGSACTATRTLTGTAVGVAASAPGPALQITAQTDGTAANTDVVSSFATDMLLTGQDTSSPYHIVLRDSAGNIVLDFRAPASPLEGHSDADVHVDVSSVLISSSVSRPAGAVTAELWKGAPGATGSIRLYSTTRLNNTAPTIQTATAVAPNDLRQAKPGASLDDGTLTVPTAEIPPKPDIVYLADTTSSMGSALDTVRSQVPTIADTVRLSQREAQFGAAHYKDFGCGGDIPYVLDQRITATVADLQTAIGSHPDTPNVGWTAYGGCDIPEAQLNALYEIAANPSTVGWRDGSTRIVAWFGDATGHDPSGEHSLDAVKTALVNANIRVVAVKVAGNGLDADGQATAIASATGGTVTSSASNSDVANAIVAGLQSLPVTVGVSSPSCNTGGFTLTLTPTSKQVTSGTTASFAMALNVGQGVAPGVYTVICHVTNTGGSAPSPDQTFTVDVSGITGPHTLVTWTATDNSTGPLHGDIAMKCNKLFHIIKTNVISDTNGKFVYDTPSGCPSGEIYVDVNDGWFLTAAVKAADVTVANTPAPPRVSIDSPTATSRILQYGVLAFSGNGKSFNGVPLTGEKLSWTLDGNVVGTSETLDLKPAGADGWGANLTNTHTLTLTGTDGAGSGTASLTFTTLGDHDNDGVSTAEEQGINTAACHGPQGVLADPDANPYNATEDNDGDGLPNGSDPAPCTTETDFEATTIMLPSRLDVSSTTGTMTLNGIYNPAFNMNAVPKSNVRITKVAGTPVSGLEWNATGWLVSTVLNGSLGAASFNRAPLVGFINDHPALIGHAILVTIAGTTTDGSKSFHADGQTFVYKSG